jgi:hypothetical protein
METVHMVPNQLSAYSQDDTHRIFPPDISCYMEIAAMVLNQFISCSKGTMSTGFLSDYQLLYGEMVPTSLSDVL